MRGRRAPVAVPAEPAAQAFEGAAHRSAGELLVTVGAKERARVRAAGDAIAVSGPGAERLKRAGGAAPRAVSCLPSGPDSHDCRSEVDIVAGERERLGDPQPRRGQQREQRHIAIRAQAARGDSAAAAASRLSIP